MYEEDEGISPEDVNLGTEAPALKELRNRFKVADDKKIQLERDLTRSNKGLARSKDFKGNHKLRSDLIVILETLASLSSELGEPALRFKAEAAYHRKMLERNLEEPLDISVIREALRTKAEVLKLRL